MDQCKTKEEYQQAMEFQKAMDKVTKSIIKRETKNIKKSTKDDKRRVLESGLDNLQHQLSKLREDVAEVADKSADIKLKYLLKGIENELGRCDKLAADLYCTLIDGESK